MPAVPIYESSEGLRCWPAVGLRPPGCAQWAPPPENNDPKSRRFRTNGSPHKPCFPTTELYSPPIPTRDPPLNRLRLRHRHASGWRAKPPSLRANALVRRYSRFNGLARCRDRHRHYFPWSPYRPPDRRNRGFFAEVRRSRDAGVSSIGCQHLPRLPQSTLGLLSSPALGFEFCLQRVEIPAGRIRLRLKMIDSRPSLTKRSICSITGCLFRRACCPGRHDRSLSRELRRRCESCCFHCRIFLAVGMVKLGAEFLHSRLGMGELTFHIFSGGCL